MSSRKKNPFLALAAAIVSIGSIVVAATVSIAGGIAMMFLPLWLIYKAG